MEEICTYEADFELVQEPTITLDLEVKQYFDGAGQTIKELLFEPEDWKQTATTEEYGIEFGRDSYGLEDFVVTSIMLWDEETQQYRSALFDYIIENIYEHEIVLLDTVIKLFSEVPCKGKIILFGQVLVEG